MSRFRITMTANDIAALHEAADELCHALAERWFEPGDVEAQTARAVAAHKKLSDLLMEVKR